MKFLVKYSTGHFDEEQIFFSAKIDIEFVFDSKEEEDYFICDKYSYLDGFDTSIEYYYGSEKFDEQYVMDWVKDDIIEELYYFYDRYRLHFESDSICFDEENLKQLIRDVNAHKPTNLD